VQQLSNGNLEAMRGGLSVQELSNGDLEAMRARARRISLVLTDCDGVLTDNSVYYSASGEEMKRFSVRDGMGVERLRNVGIQTAIITRECSLSVKKRAEKLKLTHFFLGVQDKRSQLGGILCRTGTVLDQIAYIGDDVNDLEIIGVINESGLTAAPEDAMPEILGCVHYRCSAAGGRGAFRDFVEWILRLRNGG
jgi:3-deoxy-D-manno-octulosonate 8-phosphate phosphatase (KDO 8-P phosphatase)